MPESAWLPDDYEQANSYLDDLIYWLELVPEFIVFAPSYQTLFHDEAVALNGGDIAAVFDGDNGQMYAVYAYQQTPDDGDIFAHDVFLETGTYEFNVLGIKDIDQGLLDWYLDGDIVVSGQDWFQGARQQNARSVSSFDVSGNGKHLLEGRVNGKNGESEGYFIRLTKYWFRKLE